MRRLVASLLASALLCSPAAGAVAADDTVTTGDIAGAAARQAVSAVAAPERTPGTPAAASNAVVEAVHGEGSRYEVEIRNAGMVGEISAAVWSAAGGQDDLIWQSAVRGDDGVWRTEINSAAHGGGLIVCHVYAGDKLLGGISFDTPVPEKPCTLAIPSIGGIHALMVSSVYGADKVQMAVWSEACGQDDLIWYDARYRGGGTWKTTVNPCQHHGGRMQCHVYADGRLIDAAVFSLPETHAGIRTEVREGTRYDVIIENLWGVSAVDVPTWGQANGQDDIIWYHAEKTGPAAWRASLNAASHDEGTIISHVYADGRGIGEAPRVTRQYLNVSDAAGGTVPVSLNGRSRTLLAWGPGGPADANGQPESCIDYQRRFGQYGADFVAPFSNRIYLTFDEGYENGYTSRILDILKEKKVKAVFFVTEFYVKENPELVRRMINEGHQVGNHSASHKKMPQLSDAQCLEEIMSLHRVMQRDFGYDMRLFRWPSGEFCERDLALAQALGYRSSFWSFAYRDWEPDRQIGSAAAMKKLKDSLHGGAIYLLHAVSKDNASILGDFIDYCRSQGYELSPYENF